MFELSLYLRNILLLLLISYLRSLATSQTPYRLTTAQNICKAKCPTEPHPLLGVSSIPADYCQYPDRGCQNDFFAINGYCIASDGLVITSRMDAPGMRSLINGHFAFSTDGSRPTHLSWPDAARGVGWLVMRGNRRAPVSQLSQLFTTLTPQRIHGTPSGINALALYDQRDFGGNADGKISRRDAVFSHLAVWFDENADGIAEPREVRSLGEIGVTEMLLSGSVDKYNCTQVETDVTTKLKYRLCSIAIEGGANQPNESKH